MKNSVVNNQSGHTLIEVLAVAAIIGILATVPITYLREAKIRANESAALGALNQFAAAYEMYRVINRDRFYPHFHSSGQTNEMVTFTSGQEIWDELIWQGLLPQTYKGYLLDTENLIAPGYSFSIYPVDYGTIQQYSVNPWDSYAFALIPIPGGYQPRTLALMHGEHFNHYFTNARALKTDSRDADLSNARIFTFKDPEPDEW